jgi:PAS domain-containing protein
MDWINLTMGLTLVGASMTTALVALMAIAWRAPRRRVSWTPFSRLGEATAFLFEDDALVDATPQASAILAQGPDQLDDLPRLAAVLSARFPDLAARLAELGQRQRVDLSDLDGELRLTAEWRHGLTRIALEPADAGEDDDALAGSAALRTLRSELEDLRSALDGMPIPVWREDAAGAVRWANDAYLDLVLRRDPESGTLTWPLPRLFDAAEAEAAGDAGGDRVALALPAPPGQAAREHWFEIRTVPDARGSLNFAEPVDRLAKAERTLQEFVQTLTKTFAHLPTGLAVFDRNRRLVLFNPALTDLSNLPPMFLSRRPTLFEFLDQLREQRRMPEPKDYREWRRRIGELEEAASHGTHIETWTLPDGQIYRVTGRPHPEGAVAFLIQDVTSEVAMNRRFRSELELGQSVVDSLEEAIAVFSSSGGLVLSNTAYAALWECSPDTSLARSDLWAAMEDWQSACRPAAFWEDLRAFANDPRRGTPPAAELRMADGRGLRARAARVAGNAVLVGFSLVEGSGARLVAAGGEPAEPADQPHAPDDALAATQPAPPRRSGKP